MKTLAADYHRAFKDADIRGLYPKEIDEEVTYFVARAFVDELQCKKVLVARDMRLSSPALHEAFVRGVNDAGADVVDLGLVHTPLMYFASGKLKFPGVMITASHSPRQYNGLKLVFAGAVPLTEKHGLARIRKRIDKGVFNEPRKRGVVTEKDLRTEYQTFILKGIKTERFKGVRLAVDIGNGMASVMMPLLEEKLPISCDSLFTELDGRFPNRESDPTLLKNQIALRRQLKALPYDFGVAFDGDGDRVAFLDENGRYINSAIIGAVIAQRLLKKEPGAKIVYTNLTSRVFEETIRAEKGKAVIARVGHAFIKETMRKKEALFGAEHSGHFYYRDYFYTDSIALTLLHVLAAYAEAKAEGKTFSEMMKPYLRYHQNEDVIVDVKDRERAMEKTKAYLLSLKPKGVKEFGGVAVDYGDVWGSVKISVTEYALKMMFESTHKSAAEEMQRKVVKFVESIALD
jgi:phosphomannomutase